MPYCKVDRIRLMNDDPRAQYCDARDCLDNILVKPPYALTCNDCTGFCEYDEPSWQEFTLMIECFDETFDDEYIAQILDEHFGERCGEIYIKEEYGSDRT